MRKKVPNLVSLLGLALAVALFVPQRAAADDDDPPSRVARLSYTHGNVSFEPAGTDDWVSAVVNRPITTGDKLWSDNGARAELHMGSAAIRLSSNTGFSFLNLDDRTTQIRITEGVINVRVRRLDPDETFEIDTPNLAFSILREGNYKIGVNEAGDTTTVTVRNGEGEVTGGGSAYTLHSRETATFDGIDQLDADIESFRDDGDDFDRFCSDRDHREDRSQSSRYVSSDVIGYEDLDDNGGWRSVPDYGTVWFPHTTIVGWAPYRYGHWAWVSPWGWTWVDDAPWGFAPFHYGRWVTVGGVWGWVPCAPRAVVGVAYVRPVYAPALVAWVGGPHFSIGIGIGGGGGAGVAWFPLGPREVYVPSYHVSRTYVTNVNVSNTTVNNTVVNNYYNNVIVNKNVTNITYVNQTAPNGVTATSQENFRSARPVGRNMMRVDRREVQTAHVNATTPTVAPQQRSVLGSGAEGAVRPPARLQERAVVAKTPPPAAPVSFLRQQQEIQANGGRPPAISQMRQSRVGNDEQPRSNIRMAPPVTAGTPQNGQDNPRPGEQQYNNGNRAGQQQRNDQNNSNSSVAPNNNAGQPRSNVQNNSNRPSAPGNAGQPQPDVRNNPNRPQASDNVGQPPRNAQDNSNRPSAPGNAGQPQPDGRNNPNRPTAPDNAGQAPRNVQDNSNRPPASNTGGQPPQGNQPGNSPPNNARDRSYSDRPASSRPNSADPVPPVSPHLEQKQRQQEVQLRQRQDQERQRVEQKQIQEQQKVQQNNADEPRRQQQVDQRQQQQLQQLEQKHQQEQQKLEQNQQQQQQQERQRGKPDSKPPKDKKDKEDKPARNR
jgi:hypothetical protein